MENAKHSPLPWMGKLHLAKSQMEALDDSGEVVIQLWSRLNSRALPAMIDAANAFPHLVGALNGLLDRYVSLANSGDCGFWNPEEEPQVISARAALQLAGEK